MVSEDDSTWLVELHEEHRASLHRLVVLLGAEHASGRIVRSAMLALARRSHRVIDPAERVEFLQEHVVHLARTVRASQPHITLPPVPDARQNEILSAISGLPARTAELLIVSHYLGIFGPELAGVMRMSVRGCNQRLEQALEALRQVVGEPTPGSVPGVIESLSQEATAALRSAARQVQPPGTDTLELELADRVESRGVTLSPAVVAVATVLAIALGLFAASVSRSNPAEVVASASPAPSPSVAASHQVPAQVSNIPIYFVGRDNRRLFKELRTLPASDNLVRSAMEALLTLVPRDPDYESAWAGGQVLSARVLGSTLTLDLSEESYEDFGSPVLAQLARDQVVYTASEIVGDPELRVVFQMDGGDPPDSFTSEDGFRRSGLDPMPELWISSPSNNEEVEQGPVVFAGTVKPDVGEPIVTFTDIATGNVVAEVSAQTSTGVNAEGWRVWSVRVTLAPGSYDVRAVVTFGNPPVTTSENKSVTVS